MIVGLAGSTTGGHTGAWSAKSNGGIATRLDRAWEALDLSTIHYFTASEAPIGIEHFLNEKGLVCV
ncbi:hypothetical protein [Rhizobium sp. CF080]|uniref:hypothetical protein n=1 Tax=Rhizobium sp. (strain CF080) TaxID=1144310 RepID=UPI0002715EE2|nr:hypothetical protein [Rhizobium sp. CF080]